MNYYPGGITLSGDPTPLASAEAITALWELWANPNAVTSAVQQITTWGELRALTTGEKIRLVGPQLANITIPETCPHPPPLPTGWQALTPVNKNHYPQRLSPNQYPVLHARGTIPTIPAVFITTRHHPTPRCTEVARSAALTAVSEQLPTITVLHHTSALTIIRTVLSANGQLCVVLPHAAHQPTPHTEVLNHVVENGGSILTANTRIQGNETTQSHQLNTAMDLAVKLSGSAVITDAEAPPNYTAVAIQHVIAQNTPLIMPGTQLYSSLTTTPGLPILTHPNNFDPTWYGINSRIEQRLNKKQPAADAVVDDQEQLALALRTLHPSP